jgi:hypothetical protein
MNNVCNFAEDINIFAVFVLKLLLYNLSTKHSIFTNVVSSASSAFQIQQAAFLSLSCAPPTTGTQLISGIT